MMKFLKIASQILLLTLVGFAADVIANSILPPLVLVDAAGQEIKTQNPEFTALMLLVTRFVFAVITLYVLKVSTARGFRLMALFYTGFVGLSSIMTQVETLVFLGAFPVLTPGHVGQFVLASVVSGLFFVPLAAWLCGRNKEDALHIDQPGQVGIKIFLLSVTYVAIYYFFGYFVAYRFDAVVEFYKDRPDLYPLPVFLGIQFVRGAFWVLFMLPLLKTIKTYRHKMISSVLMFSFFPTIQLIFPNPVMPEMVRLGHFVEVFSSMALFGFLIAWVMFSEIFSTKFSAIVEHKKHAT